LYGRGQPEFPSALREVGESSASLVEGCDSESGVRESVFLSYAMDDSGKSGEGAPDRQPRGVDWKDLLKAFDADSATALEKYQVARNGLMSIFRARGLEKEAEDLASEVVYRVLRHLKEKSSTHPIRDLPAFIHGVTKNVIFETRRKQRTVPFNDELDTMSPASVESPEDGAQRKEDLERFEAALNHLPESKRSLVERYFSRSKTEKIKDRAAMAQELGVKPGALRARVHKILNKMGFRVAEGGSATRANKRSWRTSGR
jgi:RNA polymerase sigma factor (sigma-70 family)